MTRQELEQGRYKNHRLYGYKTSFCDQIEDCDSCDKLVSLGCIIICIIEKIQTKRILKICKDQEISHEKK